MRREEGTESPWISISFPFSFLLILLFIFFYKFEISQSLDANQEQPLRFPPLPVPFTSTDHFTRFILIECADLSVQLLLFFFLF